MISFQYIAIFKFKERIIFNLSARYIRTFKFKTINCYIQKYSKYMFCTFVNYIR